MTHGQEQALDQLRAVEAASAGELEITSVSPPAAGTRDRLRVGFSLYTGGMPKVPEGLPLHDREPFTVSIPADFPFDVPGLDTNHARFAGFPHVQWKRHLCLYQSTATEWSPADGMYGFLDRVDQWLRRGAQNQLDAVGAPLHPPVAYQRGGPERLVVPRQNTPEVGQHAWIGFVELQAQADARVDLGRWLPISDGLPPAPVAAAILLAKPLPFEYPETLSGLLQELLAQFISKELVLSALSLAAWVNGRDAPLYVIIGTPMRGIRGSGDLKQHLAAWHIDSLSANMLRISLRKYSENPDLRNLGEEAEKLVLDWASNAQLSWCTVREDRPEVTVRRDSNSPSAWFQGKHVAIWGCGAIGGPVAEQLVRAGVGRITLFDKGTVSPGILTRQLFDDADLGRPKAEALRDRLQRIRPTDLTIEAQVLDVGDGPLESADWSSGADVVVDATASNTVSLKLELRRRSSPDHRKPVVAMVIGHRATRGLVSTALASHTAGPADLDRRTMLTCCNQPKLRSFRDEFWPAQPRTEIFQPEPGCSESTFTGSASDVAALSGIMLNLAACDLGQAEGKPSAYSHLVSLPHLPSEPDRDAVAHFTWLPDVVLCDPQHSYEVRIRDSAWRELWGWVRTSHRRSGPDVETGGLLFGQRNDAIGVICVEEILGPPPDSKSSAAGFLCGVQGTREANAEKKKRTQNTVSYVGMWHTHPVSDPLPSSTDLEGMQQLCSDGTTKNAKPVLLILGNTSSEHPLAGSYVFSPAEFADWEQGRFSRRCSLGSVSEPVAKVKRVGLALSGGGSRAIAFHLGCLRALHDRGILDQLQVISGVSGGAVIGAMFAYSDDPFAEFDARVVQLLKRGLVAGILKSEFLGPRFLLSLGTMFTSGVVAAAADACRLTLAAASRLPLLQDTQLKTLPVAIQPPFRRWVSRTDAFEAALQDELFGEKLMASNRRNDIGVVLNACELQTTSAFRFGSRESGSWRLGMVKNNDVKVATAVAASAAYPALLPALDRNFHLVNPKTNQERSQRVILTDGGVFDNLGTTCLEPGRTTDFSTNVYHPPYLICCDAGPGLFDDMPKPYWWPTRMKRSFEAVFRKAKDAGNTRLHQFLVAGAIKGFVLAYLGQQDGRLPWRPAELVPREAVSAYPTDFSPMRPDDIDRLSKRGEQLTRALLDHYWRDL